MENVMKQEDLDFALYYSTAGSREEAERICQVLLDEKLIACANIFAPMASIYSWKGQVQKETEVPFWLKSRGSFRNQLEDRIKSLHSYDCPCFIQISVDALGQDFANWAMQQLPPSEKP